MDINVMRRNHFIIWTMFKTLEYYGMHFPSIFYIDDEIVALFIKDDHSKFATVHILCHAKEWGNVQDQ